MAFSVSAKKYWYKSNPGDKRIMLPKALMQTFANKQITCIEYDGLSDDQEREIFQVSLLSYAHNDIRSLLLSAYNWE